MTATDEKYMKHYGRDKLELKWLADTIANVLMFQSHRLPKELIVEFAQEIVKALPDTEPYIDPDNVWDYYGDHRYEHKLTHEVRRYP